MAHSDELIRRYLDGELAPADALELRDHLATCDRCRMSLAALERLDARLRNLDRLVPTRDFTARVRAHVAALPPPQRPSPWLGALVLMLALGGLLGVLAAVDDLFALTDGLMSTANSALAWMLELVSGEAGLSDGSFGWLGAGTQPTLVVGLCLLVLASALVLRRSLENQVEV
jgi:anti-sigma factor RsiW